MGVNKLNKPWQPLGIPSAIITPIGQLHQSLFLGFLGPGAILGTHEHSLQVATKEQVQPYFDGHVL